MNQTNISTCSIQLKDQNDQEKTVTNTGYDVLLNAFSPINKIFKNIPAEKQILHIKRKYNEWP